MHPPASGWLPCAPGWSAGPSAVPPLARCAGTMSPVCAPPTTWPACWPPTASPTRPSPSPGVRGRAGPRCQRQRAGAHRAGHPGRAGADPFPGGGCQALHGAPGAFCGASAGVPGRCVSDSRGPGALRLPAAHNPVVSRPWGAVGGGASCTARRFGSANPADLVRVSAARGADRGVVTRSGVPQVAAGSAAAPRQLQPLGVLRGVGRVERLRRRQPVPAQRLGAEAAVVGGEVAHVLRRGAQLRRVGPWVTGGRARS